MSQAAVTAELSRIEAKVGYVTCATGASYSAKTVSLSDFSLTTGIRLVVKMSYANTATSPTLNVNNTGAKTLYYNGNPATADNTWEDGETLDVYYDGTNYQWRFGQRRQHDTGMGHGCRDHALAGEAEPAQGRNDCIVQQPQHGMGERAVCRDAVH